MKQKWRTWLVLLCISIAGAISLTFITSPRTQQQSLYAEEGYEERTVTTQTALQVAFPTNYREQFVQYATVDCPNSRIVHKMYVNPMVLDRLQTTETVPSGTVLVMETHSAQQGSDGQLAPTRLNNVFIREKRDGWQINENSGEWQSAWYSPQGRLVSSSQGSCIGCHTRVRDRDYLFTLPALLSAAQTNQPQHQNTEFGTSVCR